MDKYNFIHKLDIPKIISKIENISINEGEDAIFSCKFISFPLENKITWYKNDTFEISNGEDFNISKEDGASIIKINKPKSNENGSTYLVKISNEIGEVTSNKAILNISSGPAFILAPSDQNVLKEKEAKFECIVKSNPKPNVVWILNEKELSNKDGVRIEKDLTKDKYSLTIPKVLVNHIGTYTVKAVNEFGSNEKQCILSVSELPKVLTKLENILVNEKDQAKFTIKISGKPKPSNKWFKDESELIINENIEITENEDEITLSIKSCDSSENSGVYFVKIFNEFGEAVSNKSTLTINS